METTLLQFIVGIFLVFFISKPIVQFIQWILKISVYIAMVCIAFIFIMIALSGGLQLLGASTDTVIQTTESIREMHTVPTP